MLVSVRHLKHWTVWEVTRQSLNYVYTSVVSLKYINLIKVNRPFSITGQAWSWKNWKVGPTQCIRWWAQPIFAKGLGYCAFATFPSIVQLKLFTCFVCFFPYLYLTSVYYSLFFGYSTYYTGRRNSLVMVLGTVGLMAWRIMRMNKYASFEFVGFVIWVIFLNQSCCCILFGTRAIVNFVWLSRSSNIRDTSSLAAYDYFSFSVPYWPGNRCNVDECKLCLPWKYSYHKGSILL